MEFRWMIFLTLWTAFSGPILAAPAKKQISAQTVQSTSSPAPTR